jgi:hypothetical protein
MSGQSVEAGPGAKYVRFIGTPVAIEGFDAICGRWTWNWNHADGQGGWAKYVPIDVLRHGAKRVRSEESRQPENSDFQNETDEEFSSRRGGVESRNGQEWPQICAGATRGEAMRDSGC